MIYLLVIIILLGSIIIHEVAHGAVAYHLGDPTAKYAGRLSLNPIKHLDPIGSFLLPLFLVLLQSPLLFGWAKPVPINPYNFRDQKYGQLKVSLAGVATNFFLALLFSLPLRFFPDFFLNYSTLFFSFGIIVYINLILAIFNLLPVPPLDGSHILFHFASEKTKMFFQQYGLIILIFVIFFLLGHIFVFINFIFEQLVGFSANWLLGLI